MTAGPEIQRAEQFAKSQTPLGIASGDASGIGGAASRLSFNEAAKGRSSYEVFGGFSEAAGSISDKNGSTNRLGSYAMMGAMTAGIASIAPGMLSAMPGISGSALGGILGPGTAIPGVGLAIGGGILATGAIMEAYNAMNPDKERVTIGSAWKNISREALANRATARYNGANNGGYAGYSANMSGWYNTTKDGAVVSGAVPGYNVPGNASKVDDGLPNERFTTNAG